MREAAGCENDAPPGPHSYGTVRARYFHTADTAVFHQQARDVGFQSDGNGMILQTLYQPTREGIPQYERGAALQV